MLLANRADESGDYDDGAGSDDTDANDKAEDEQDDEVYRASRATSDSTQTAAPTAPLRVCGRLGGRAAVVD